MARHFYNTADFAREEILDLVKLGLSLKQGKATAQLAGRTLALLFFNPSLRTRVSFEMAMHRLGGRALDLAVREGTYTLEFEKGRVMDAASAEHVAEAAGVLSRYCDALAVRASELVTRSAESAASSTWSAAKQDQVLQGFMRYATVPVINMESNVYHPCQGLADSMTIAEKLGRTEGRKFVLTWTYHPKALPMATPHSQILAACDLGMDITVCFPEGWDLDPELVKLFAARAETAAGRLRFSNSMEEAFAGAEVICAKSWGALRHYGDWQAEAPVRAGLRSWVVDPARMALTDNAYFMHCLPVRRNVEVTDEVLDSDRSIVLDQAENRMWAQMGLLTRIMRNG